MSLEMLVGLVSLGTAVGPGLIWLIRRILARLTAAERAILAACAKEGRIWVLRTDRHGDWVRAGERDFFDSSNPAYNASFLEALERLIARGVVRHDSGMLYVLTGTGFDRARKLVRAGRR